MNRQHASIDAPASGSRAFDFAVARRRSAANPEAFWSSLEELADTPGFREWLHREFPAGASEWPDPVSRRRFLKLIGASLALAGLTSCTRQPMERIVPRVRQAEGVSPGEPIYFATALPFNGYATGVLVESHEGRPTKVEGNPEHPASMGASSVFEQAAILELYDPDRARALTRNGNPATWDQFVAASAAALKEQQTRRGAGLRVLTGTVASPTLAAQLQALRSRFPESHWHVYEPWSRENIHQGARLGFGEEVEPHYSLEQADVILSLDADFLFSHPNRLRLGREFARRRAVSGEAEMNRLYAAESAVTVTGSMADHRLPLRAGAMRALAHAVAQSIAGGALRRDPAGGVPDGWIDAVAGDLRRHRERSLVIAGEQQPAEVHALTHWMNRQLGNEGRTVTYLPVASAGSNAESIEELVQALNAGDIEVLLILDGNPALTAPVDLDFSGALARAGMTVHWSLYHNDTSRLSQWHIPAAHGLESWSDLRALDGTVSVLQPLILPLYGGRTAHELLAAWLQSPVMSPHDLVRESWRGQEPSDDFDRWWRRVLHDGVMAGSAFAPKQVSLQWEPPTHPPSPPAEEGIEVTFRPDPTLWDGRFANNAWLQELPKPITKLTWDNPAHVSPALAERLGLASGDMVEIRLADRSIEIAVWVQAGEPNDSIALHLGFGGPFTRTDEQAGFNTHSLRTSGAAGFATGAQIRKLDRRYRLAATQLHHRLEGRDLARAGTLALFRRDPRFASGHETGPMLYNLTAERQSDYQWGMVINLGTCIGCSACTIACQAENNIPVVGKAEVLRGREMHWIRVDSWFRGDFDNPAMCHQPVPCMHCETAPCEYVCPVAATTHSHEGLNEMTYNRCIGTRYCSNNCPYKVRRFNFFEYSSHYSEPSLRMLLNPEVTVRARGVMEKCTYCVQRISRARIQAKRENRSIADGEVIPACAQACPAEAIVFGDISDPGSAVSKLKAQPLNYGMLAELNTRPRTTYLARVSNPNPDLTVPAAHSQPAAP